ncbi:MAG: type II secretion system protein N [Betaproteobacteria bacterium]|nr:type II secretion system protein N [Betaproteobacteria bacterium]
MWRWVLFFLAVLLIALAARLPASWAVSQVQDRLKAKVDIDNVKGTIWQGSADLKLPQGIVIEQATWEVAPIPLLFLSPRFTLQSASPDLKGRTSVALGFRSVEINELDATVTARLVSAIEPRIGALAPEGSLRIMVYQMDCFNDGCEGQTRLQWENAAVALSELRPLGDYLGILDLKRTKAHYELKTMKGTLRAAGRGNWEQGKLPTFTGELSAPPDQLSKVQGLMRLLGTPDERGVLRINR